MTIIYDYQNCKKVRKPIIYTSSGCYYLKRKRSFINKIDLREYFGHIKVFVLLLGPLLISLVYWIILYGQNISLDFQIYKLKTSLKEKEDKLAALQEEVANQETISKITQWAEQNGFVKVKNISYLNLEEENLAQNKFLRF